EAGEDAAGAVGLDDLMKLLRISQERGRGGDGGVGVGQLQLRGGEGGIELIQPRRGGGLVGVRAGNVGGRAKIRQRLLGGGALRRTLVAQASQLIPSAQGGRIPLPGGLEIRFGQRAERPRRRWCV